MEIKELVDQLNAKSQDIKSTQEQMQNEIKSNGEVSTELKSKLTEHESQFTELKGLFDAVDEKLKDLEAKSSRPDAGAMERKSLGELFTQSDVYGECKSNNRGNGAPFTMDKKDISGLSTSAGALVRPDRDGRVFQDPNRPTRIRDLIPSVPTSSSSVEFVRENVFTENAGPQGTVAGVGQGEFQTKNQSDITYEVITKPVSTIAHWMPASRQVLSDAPMLQNLINNRLTYGLDLESDRQLLLGDGTGQNMTGLMVDAGISDVGQIASGTTAAELPGAMIDHIRSAITELQKNEYYNVNGLVLNPVDWETLETAKATDGHYLMVSMPTGRATESVWRVPVVVTNAMTASNFLLGDFNMGAVVYDREDVSVRVSESHANYFIQNAVAILAEERYTMGIPLPKAFCKGQFTVAV